MTSISRLAVAVLAAAWLAAAPANAETSAPQKQEIEKIVHDYLLAHPEVIEDAMNALKTKRDAEALVAQQKAIDGSSDMIFRSPNQMVLGNPDGAISLVEFFDYNCGYCKRSVADMAALLKANPDLRVVMKEFPILAQGSVDAARISVAIKEDAPQSYWKFHQELFSRPGQATGEKALEVAKDIGLDIDKLKTIAARPDVTANLQEVQKLADALGISGTPSYVIGKELVPGAAGYDVLQQKVTAMRQCGATAC